MTGAAVSPSVPPHPPAAGHAAADGSAALSRELADFLVELAIALHKNAIYPEGHPLLDTAVNGVDRRLRALFEPGATAGGGGAPGTSGIARGTLSLGVARHQLVIEGVATDANHPLLRELAGKLHRHHLGAVRFLAGVAHDELSEFLRAVAEDAWRTNRPLGLADESTLARWPHVRLYALTYAQLELLEESGDPEPETGVSGPGGPLGGADRAPTLGRTRAAQLWIGLARAALARDSVSHDGPRQDDPAAGAPDDEHAESSTDPVVVAKAIDDHGRGDVAYDQVVVGYLLQIAEELKAKQGKEAMALQRRISRLVGTLQPDTLRRLLEMGGDSRQRRRFVLDASQGMAVDAVVDLVRAAADTSQQTVSHSMVRLLSKFALHAEHGTVTAQPEADGALREQVGRLLGDWNLADPNPESYRRVLEGLARAAPAFDTQEHAFPCEPERLVQMALETGAMGESLWRAIDVLLARGRLPMVLGLLTSAPASWVAEQLWAYVASAERLHALLAEPTPDFALVARLVTQVGEPAVGPLLDALELTATGNDARDGADAAARWDARSATTNAAARTAEQERQLRGLLELLPAFGPTVAGQVASRLPALRWVAIPVLLDAAGRALQFEAPGAGVAGATSAGAAAADDAQAQHEDAVLALATAVQQRDLLHHPWVEVRREALRALLASPAHRAAAVCVALVDGDERLVRRALKAATVACPPAAIEALRARAVDETLPSELRAAAVRLVAADEAPDTAMWLAGLVVTRARFSRPRLAPTTPELLAALTGLSAAWAMEPSAREALELGRSSTDADIRRAATARTLRLTSDLATITGAKRAYQPSTPAAGVGRPTPSATVAQGRPTPPFTDTGPNRG